MATGTGAHVLRADADAASIFPSRSRRLMAILAQRFRKLGSDVPTVIQARPALTFGVLSVLLAAGLAARKTRPFSRRQTLRHRLRHGRRQIKAALDLPPLVIKLLSNPLVQSYLRRTVLRTVSRKLGR